MPIDLYPNIAKVKRNNVFQNLPGFVQQNGDADIEAMIANKEISTTAQYVHPKGTFFILNDVLYKAIIDIAVNDAIAVGTNCEVAVLSDDVAFNTSQLDVFNYTGENLFDKNDPDVLIGQYYDGTTLKSSSTLGQTGYIPVTPYCKYLSSRTDVFVQFYDESKNFILKVTSQDYQRVGYVLAPYNAAYGRFIFAKNAVNSFEVYKLNMYGQKADTSGLIKNSTLSANDVQIKFVACAVRRPTANDSWDFISDGSHTPLNVSAVTVNQNHDIEITYNFVAKQVISFIVGCDETYVNYRAGASVGLEKANFSIYDPSGNHVNAEDLYHANGNFWVIGLFAV